jgi:hypothetical protein
MRIVARREVTWHLLRWLQERRCAYEAVYMTSYASPPENPMTGLAADPAIVRSENATAQTLAQAAAKGGQPAFLR